MMFVQVVDLKQGEDLSVDFKAFRVAFRYVHVHVYTCMYHYTCNYSSLTCTFFCSYLKI